MPRGQKSKLRSREKRRHARDDSQSHKETQASVIVEQDLPSFSSPVCGDIPLSSSAVGLDSTSQGPWRVQPMDDTSADISDKRSDEGDNNQDEENLCSLDISSSPESLYYDSIDRKVDLLEQFMLYKYKMKQPILKADILKIVSERYQDQFDQILRKASERIEVIFAVSVKEIDSANHSYNLVSKLKLPNNGRVRAGRGLPKTGLLMTILGVIFIKGNRASEEDIWKFLNMMRVHAGRKHFIYGEPRKLITQDLVRLKYLVYRQVPYSYPPLYEFLWGPKAHAETSKMEVLEFLAKVSGTVPSAFSTRYEEALQDEEERAQARIAAEPRITTMANSNSYLCSKAPSTSVEF